NCHGASDGTATNLVDADEIPNTQLAR
ncbi:MAG: hypothetical protein RL605_628, partial [Actinomycetota bacterium]